MEDFEASCPGVHRRSLQRDLRALIEKQLIVAEGATNRLIYRVAGKP
jgi:DNA-binding HxlR family transcriptional regulator